jgi:3-isopropylmalate dehydratase small subunit
LQGIRLKAKAVPLEMSDVDTDQIIPAEFLKIVERKGLSKYLFYRLRYDNKGNLTGNFVLDKEEYRGAEIIVASSNFGIGSSRENAVWALLDAGIKCVIASSFGDIFYNNALRNGLVCIRLEETKLKELRELARKGEAINIDLDSGTIEVLGSVYRFEVDQELRRKLISKKDEITETLERFGKKIEQHEKFMPRFFIPASS